MVVAVTVTCALAMACVGWPAIPARAQHLARATGTVSIEVIGPMHIAQVSYTQDAGVVVRGDDVDYRIVDTITGNNRTVWVMY